MIQNYLSPVEARELRNPELFITLALLISGGVGKNKLYINAKSDKAKALLQKACSALYVKAELLSCDTCKNRFYLKPRGKVLGILAKQCLLPDFTTQTWSCVSSKLPICWQNLSVSQIECLKYQTETLVGTGTSDKTMDIKLRNGLEFAKQLSELFAKVGHIYCVYSPTQNVNILVHKFYQPDQRADDDFSDLM